MSVLYCFYDMSVSPCSYDFFSFFQSAEICRMRRGFNEIKLILVHGPKHFFRDDEIRTKSQNETFFHNVIIPGISLLPSCKSFMWLSRNEANLNLSHVEIFPRGYKIEQPQNSYTGRDLVTCKIRQDRGSLFRAPTYTHAIVDQFITEKLSDCPFVTVSVRELQREDKGNTRRTDANIWNEAAERLEKLGIRTVVIRDTAETFGHQFIDNAVEAPFASVHLPMRMALYEKSKFNFTKNNGPALLQLFGHSPCMLFNSVDEEVISMTSDWFSKHLGMTQGSQFPMTSEDKHYLWTKETVELIEEAAVKALNGAYTSSINYKFTDEKNLSASINAGLSQFLRDINFCLLPEDLLFFKKLNDVNDQFKFTDSLIDLIADTESKGLKKEAFERLYKAVSSQKI